MPSIGRFTPIAGCVALLVFPAHATLAQQGAVQVTSAVQTLHGDPSRFAGQNAFEPDVGISWLQPGSRFGVFQIELRGARRGDAFHTGRMYGPSTTAGVWTLPPANLTYTIGASVPAADWYFAQSVTGTWTVSFSLASVPAGGGFLTLAIAGAARNPHLEVAVNGQSVVSHTFGNDQSLYRSALSGGHFERLSAAVPAAALRAGANTATFQLTNGSGGAGIYYDVITFESD